MKPRHPAHDTTAVEQRDRGRQASQPTVIPRRGWRDILLRAKEKISQDHLSISSAGVAFYLLLGMVPALAAFISIYGLIANPAQIKQQLLSFNNFMPKEALQLIQDQTARISQQSKVAGWATVVSVAISLWGASSGILSLIEMLNITYEEDEKRGFVRLRLTAILIALGAVVVGLFAVFLIVALPSALRAIGIENTNLWANIVRWPILLLIAITAFSFAYRYGPSRAKPKWKWVTLGSIVATLLWLGGSALFSFYASHFGSYNKTYGSLAAVVVLMLWLYLSVFTVAIGAVLNAETEHQTAVDTTTGPPKQMGERGAYVADDLGESK